MKLSEAIMGTTQTKLNSLSWDGCLIIEQLADFIATIEPKEEAQPRSTTNLNLGDMVNASSSFMVENQPITQQPIFNQQVHLMEVADVPLRDLQAV